MKLYKKFLSFLLVYRWQFVVFLLCLTVLAFLNSIQPYFYKLFVDAIPEGDLVAVSSILFWFILVRFVELLMDVATYWFGDMVHLPAARDARIAVFKKIQDLDFAYHHSRSTGALISTIKRGDSAFFNFFHVSISIFRVLVGFLTIVILFFTLRVPIAVALFTTMAATLLVSLMAIKKNVAKRRVFVKNEDRISEVIVDNMINFETVKLFAQESFESQRLRRNFKPWLHSLWQYANTFRYIDIIVGIGGTLSLFVVLYLGLQLLDNDPLWGLERLTTGEYIMILGFVSNFYPRFFQLIYEIRNIARDSVDLRTYFDVLEHETQVKDPEKPVKLQSIKGEVEFKNVSFSYKDGKEHALKDFTLRIRQGQSVAFVGHSGAGKTTITKLLLRFHDVSEGKITIDGIDIKDMTKSQLRSFMGVVPQEPILFNDTIAYNIGYAAQTDALDEIRAAARLARLDEFIGTLPEGYDTKVGERGVKLSGGQKQRLAIARMILSNPDIIIFDEATSQLDSESERLIQEAFWKASKNKTTVIIAHRLSSITRADKIVVLEKGRIVEIGTHRSLLRKAGSKYRYFWELQTEK